MAAGARAMRKFVAVLVLLTVVLVSSSVAVEIRSLRRMNSGPLR